MMAVADLKRLDLDGILDLDELINLAAGCRMYRAEYEHRQIEVPEFLDNVIRDIGREITRRTADSKAKLLRDLKAARASLATPEEKRKKLEEQIAALEGATV